MNGAFTVKTKNILAKRANEKCSICKKQTSKPSTASTSEYINTGEAAHIKGAKSGSARYDPLQSDDERSHINNAIWLCNVCHKEADTDLKKYDVAYLISIKKEHEKKVANDEFEINWKEYQQLQKRVIELEELYHIKSSLHNSNQKELLKLKVELESTRNEINDLENHVKKLKTALSVFTAGNTSENENKIINAIQVGDLDDAILLLKESDIEQQEFKLAQKRILKAVIFEIQKKYNKAEKEYYKAYSISDNFTFLEYLVLFLRRLGKGDIAKEICLQHIKRANSIELLVLTGRTYVSLNDNKTAIAFFYKALTAIKNDKEESHNNPNLEKARIQHSIASCNKRLGNYKDSLTYYEKSINTYFSDTVSTGIMHHSDLARLQNDIGNLYLDNNNPNEALKFFSVAETNFKEEKYNPLHLALLYINFTNAYIHHKILDYIKARIYIEKSISILKEQYNNQPLLTVEYYIGALKKSGDLYTKTNQQAEATKDYNSAINIYLEIKSIIEITYFNTIPNLYLSYASLLIAQGDISSSNNYIENAITMLHSLNDTEEEKHYNLATAYFMQFHLLNNKTDKLKALNKAHSHITQCNYEHKLLNRALKLAIEHSLKVNQ